MKSALKLVTSLAVLFVFCIGPVGLIVNLIGLASVANRISVSLGCLLVASIFVFNLSTLLAISIAYMVYSVGWNFLFWFLIFKKEAS